MFNTMFLTNENYFSKSFSRMNVNQLNVKRGITVKDKKGMWDRISQQSVNPNAVRLTNGDVYLSRVNEVYWLEYVNEKTDVILPAKPQLMDFVSIFYDQMAIGEEVSYDARSLLTVRGNGERIMALDEPLVCDIPFMSLRFTYCGPIDGWVVC